MERLPTGCRLTPETLTLPDNMEIEFGAIAADKHFPGIFRSSCRNPPTDDELAAVNAYTVNVFLKGPGGSLEAARTMMHAGAAMIQAGGAGVFIDIVEVIRYLSRGDKPMGHGHVLADQDRPRFQAFAEDSPAKFAESPLHNPFGRLKLMRFRDIAEGN